MKEVMERLFWRYFGVAFFVALVLSVPSIWLNFFPSEGWAVATGIASAIPALLSLFFIFSKKSRAKIERGRNPRLLRKGQWVLGIGFPISMFAFVWLDTCQLGGFLFTTFFGTQHNEQVVGSLETQSIRAAGCRRYIRISEIPGHRGDRLCGSVAFLEAAPKFVTMNLHGQKSLLGFRVTTYDR